MRLAVQRASVCALLARVSSSESCPSTAPSSAWSSAIRASWAARGVEGSAAMDRSRADRCSHKKPCHAAASPGSPLVWASAVSSFPVWPPAACPPASASAASLGRLASPPAASPLSPPPPLGGAVSPGGSKGGFPVCEAGPMAGSMDRRVAAKAPITASAAACARLTGSGAAAASARLPPISESMTSSGTTSRSLVSTEGGSRRHHSFTSGDRWKLQSGLTRSLWTRRPSWAEACPRAAARTHICTPRARSRTNPQRPKASMTPKS
mmetsp:Transcript_21660/g.48971  ORF Transcript_21660/g.48971 Transcript_21660/m.48971 type:complete len:266 (-) Transcript_21660:124-921(-)